MESNTQTSETKTVEDKPKILIVDDDGYLRDIYVDKFREAGFEVLQGRDGLEGLDIATRDVPDIIFTGIVMPRMDGFEFVRQLRLNLQTRNVPFVIFSHLGREEDRKTAADLGAKAFLVKGMVPPNEIVSTIENILRGKVYRVVVKGDQLDGMRLAEQLGADGDFTLELSEVPNQDVPTYTAKLIEK